MALTFDRHDAAGTRFVRWTFLAAVVSRLLPLVSARQPRQVWREWAGVYRAVAIGADALVAMGVTATVTAAHYSGVDRLVLTALAGLGFVIAVASQHGYDTGRAAAGREELRALLRAGGVLVVASMTVNYVDLVHLPRLVVFEALAIALGLVIALRLVQRRVVQRMRTRGALMRRTIVVGLPSMLRPVLEELGENPTYGFAVVGICVPEPGAEGTLTDVPVLGALHEVPHLIRECGAETVVVSSGCMTAAELRRFCWRVEGLGAELLIAPNISEVSPARITMLPVSGTALLTVAIGPTRARRWGKSVLDRALGSLLLLGALLVLLPAALAVRLTSPGPVVFRQTRVGNEGVPFTMVKLRTMYVDAEARRASLLTHSDGNETLFKMRRDPRITSAGHVLRRFSIDELPQLWNVVRGDMSLVGPRPPLMEEVARYDDMAYHRLHVKPGLTGLWQVSGRSDLSWEQSVRLDLRYVDNWSLWMDLTILWRTFRAVFGGRGAY
ncbi:MAG: sugar transferase [Actinomycetales bacterium]|nr:sugar transferase [Actinomycetales bacterium]